MAVPFLGGVLQRDGPEHVVAGAVEEVSIKLQDGLADAGIGVLEERQHGEVKLAGATRSGKMFILRLKGLPATEGERTAVTLRWERETDERFWPIVLRLLPAAAPAKDAPATDRARPAS
jgi:hypothetical protein